ncbi:hypothetical protein KIL84_010117 [Mauremys mutica]|uniref:Ig-like domain-containing protein n=1 Tax=Mauremys mutica TaxID=74926 RepID=A0A9D3XN86_9SAUR|nr:hypothetical protein KIL84_010117 [Mauremys mutica]
MWRPWQLFPRLLLLLVNIPWGSCQAEVHQNLSAVTREGQNGSISCHYTASNFWNLQWFRQLPGGQPVSLLILVSDEKQTKEPNLTAELDKGKRLSSLHIRESQLGDAATYFCAVATQ